MEDECKCTSCSGESAVTTAIRAMGKIDQYAVQAILNCLAAKMQQSGFSDVDLQMVDETADFICGVTA